MPSPAGTYRFDIAGGGPVAHAMQVAFGPRDRTAKGWKFVEIDGIRTLVLLWFEREGHPLPTPMSWNMMYPIVEEWLKHADRGKEPDTDGSVGPGWRIFNEAWGHVAGEHQAICGIQPQWIVYGK